MLDKIKNFFTSKNNIVSKDPILVKKDFKITNNDLNIKDNQYKVLECFYVKWKYIYDIFKKDENKVNVVIPLLLVFGNSEYGNIDNYFLKDYIYMVLVSDCDIKEISFKGYDNCYHKLEITSDTIFDKNEEFNKKIKELSNLKIHILHLKQSAEVFESLDGYADVFGYKSTQYNFIRERFDENDIVQSQEFIMLDFSIKVLPTYVPTREDIANLINILAEDKKLFPPKMGKDISDNIKNEGKKYDWFL